MAVDRLYKKKKNSQICAAAIFSDILLSWISNENREKSFALGI